MLNNNKWITFILRMIIKFSLRGINYYVAQEKWLAVHDIPTSLKFLVHQSNLFLNYSGNEKIIRSLFSLLNLKGAQTIKQKYTQILEK